MYYVRFLPGTSESIVIWNYLTDDGSSHKAELAALVTLSPILLMVRSTEFNHVFSVLSIHDLYPDA